MEYEAVFEEIRALPKGSITLQFLNYGHRCCEQTEWNSEKTKVLCDLSFNYFTKHGYEDSGSTSYWVDIKTGLALKIEASDTKLRPDRAVQCRMLLRRFARKKPKPRKERCCPLKCSKHLTKSSLPRGLLLSLNGNQRHTRNEDTFEFYIPLIQVNFIVVPSSSYLSLSMPPEERQRISRQLPENCSVKVPLTPFPAVKVQAGGKGERFIGLLSHEESVAFYITMDEAERREVTWEIEETFTVYPPIAMRHIISRINMPTLLKHFIIRTSKYVMEKELFQSERMFEDFLSILTEQNRTSSKAPTVDLVPQTPPGYPPPLSLVDPQVVQNLKRPSTPPGLKSLGHFVVYSGSRLLTISNSPGSSEHREKCEIER